MKLADTAEESSNHEFTQVPFCLPRLFASPSCLPEFSDALEDVARKKTELILNENMEEARLEIECLEINAYEMRKKLVQRIYVEVSSVKEMRAVNALWCGTGAGSSPGMKCFRGTVYVSMNLQQDMINAIVEDCQASNGPVILFYGGYDFRVSTCLARGVFYKVKSPNCFYRIQLGH